MFGITLRLFLTSLWISYVFQDKSHGCCVHNRCKFRRKLCGFHAATFHRLRILSSRILFCYTVVFLTFFPAATVFVLSDFLESDVWTISFKLLFLHLTFVFPCIVNVIKIDDKQDATLLIYLLLISSTCFGRCFRPSSGAYHCNYSFWYCPPMLLTKSVPHNTQHQPAAASVDNTRSCSYSDMRLMMGETSPETCRYD